MKLKKRKMNQKGFTLIEIIAVLVILAIMAAVAIPKYLNMQQQACNDAAQGACAAAASNVTMVYSNMLVNGAGSITGTSLATALSVSTYTNLGGWTATYAAMANTTIGITITVSPPSGVAAPTANTTKNLIMVQ
jgi:prepilin-type N-terminal cleavage/methylation domain-containing protein